MHIPLPSTLAISLSLLSSTLTTTNALPPATSTIQTSPPFILTSNLKTHDTGNPAFAYLNLTSYHTGAGTAYAVLQNGPARVAYLNGTATDFAAHTTDLLFRGEQFPFGLVLRLNAPVEITAGEGTNGVYVDDGAIQTNTAADSPVPGGFYACNSTTLPYGPAVQVFYRTAEGSKPAACSDIDLRVSYFKRAV